MTVRAGFTEGQIAFINSLPWNKSVSLFQGNPYIPGAIVLELLNTAFGADGWSYEIEELTETRQTYDHSNKGKRWDVIGKARVRLVIGLRDAEGFLVPGAQIFRTGVGVHSANVYKVNLLGTAIDNANAPAVTRAIRNAAVSLGPVFGRDVMRKRKDNTGKPLRWQSFCSLEPPKAPDLHGIGGGDLRTTLDASSMVEEESWQSPEPPAPSAAPQPHAPAQPPAQPPATPAQPPATPAQPPATQPTQQSMKTRAATPAAQRLGYEACPAYMSPSVWAAICAAELPAPPDGRPFAVRFLNPDGSQVVRFAGQVKKSVDDLLAGGATAVEVRIRQRGMTESGEVRLNAPAVAGDEDERRGLVREIRACFRTMQPGQFLPIVEATGSSAAKFASPPSAGGLTVPALHELLARLRVGG